jgi:DNA modification methylase
MLKEEGDVLMKEEELGSDLFRELIFRFSARRDVVLDLFGGSFSSAVAALASSRKYVGVYLFHDG